MRAGTMDGLQWRNARIAAFPAAWSRRALKRHDALGGIFSVPANEWLRDTAERVEALRVPIDLSDGELRDMARKLAREAMNLASGPLIYSPEQYRERLARFAAGYGIQPPAVTVTDTGAIKRMTDELWWRRRLRVAQGRALEREAIALGYVHKRAEPYASNVTVERRQQQKARNLRTLEGTDCINLGTGEVLTLAEIAERANANPAIRRGELMTRIAGFEAIAQGLGDVAEFVTLTTPSKYHAQRVGEGGRVEPNPKWNGATPKDGQGYLNRVWARIRAAYGRLGIRPYGFRVAEPHHDATPHWHLLLFVARAQVEKLRAIIREHALREDGNEAGAQKNRVEFVTIDPSKGSAAGYIAKYVAKNIDGYQVQADFETGRDAVSSAPRVEAWAATWGIRQFQQIGGAPVGVWRELRRLREADASRPEVFELARAAADAGNWRRYVELQGGPTVARDELRLRAEYTAEGGRWCALSGEVLPALNGYGEPAAPSVYGVRVVKAAAVIPSRLVAWEIRRGNASIRASNAGLAALEGGPGAGVCVASDSSQAFDAAMGLGFPRTRVNNCTEGGKDAGTKGGGIGGQAGKIQVFPDHHGGARVGRDSQGLGGGGSRTGAAG